MDAVDREIRQLAGIRSSADPVVSVYLDTRWSDEQQRQKVRLFVEDQSRAAREQRPDDEAFGRSLERVGDYVHGLVEQAYDEEADGVALFACDGLGLFRAITVHQSFEPQRFTVSKSPDVLPLVHLRGSFPPAAVALVEASGARVIETGLGEVIAESTVQGDVHRRHSMGGWSQSRYQRGIRQQIQWNHEEAAKLLERLYESEPRQLFAVAGPDRGIAAFRRELPQRIDERVFWTMPNPRERSDREARVRDELLQRLFEALVDRARLDGERDVTTAIGHASAGVGAVADLEGVTLAANEGRIHRLLLRDDLPTPGYLCRICDALHAHVVERCDYCGGEVGEVLVRQELVRKVLDAQAEVDVVSGSPDLDRRGGAAAVLRPGSAELGVASPPPG